MGIDSDSVPDIAKAQPAEKRSNVWLPTCLIGCLGIVILSGVAIVGSVWWVASNTHRLVKTAIVTAVETSDLNEQDKAAVRGQVERVFEAYDNGEIDERKFKDIVQEISSSPIMSIPVVTFLEQQYVSQSGLNDEEAAAAKITVQRLARGVIERKISKATVDGLVDMISEPGQEGQIKAQLSDEELRAFLAECKRLADEVSIPEEAYVVNIGEEVRKAVDRALAQ
ncbi:MAG: hypothetical protein QGG36_26845 [Pirellulaceae bacterium]|nr:hypothetical protein [Pirellulaceae bacterium]